MSHKSSSALRARSGPRNAQPAGRILARKIQELTNDGDELAQFAIRIFRCATPAAKASLQEEIGIEITDRIRLDMHDWLTVRGFGMPLQAIEITMEDDRTISDEELLAQLLASFPPAELRAAAARAEAAAAILDAAKEPAEVH